MSFKNYDPSLILMSFNNIPLVSIAEGTFVTAERAEDAFSMSVGVGGDVTRVRNRNRTGSITVTLKAEAPENDLLSALAQLDELAGLGVGVVSVMNLNGTTLCESTVAWIVKLPKVDYSDKGDTREWKFDCAELEMFVGGAIA